MPRQSTNLEPSAPMGWLRGALALQVGRSLSMVVFCLLTSVSVAAANPFFIGRFDGIEGGILNTGAYSSYWNPAGMVRAGSKFQLHTMTVYRMATFDRFIEENGIEPQFAEVNGGKNQTGRVGIVPGMAMTHTFTPGNWLVALGGGFFIDRAGTMKWDSRENADPAYPGAIDGPQRWAGIGTRFAIISPGLGLAIGHKKSKVSMGATLLLNFADLTTVRAQNVGRTDAVVDDRGQLAEGRILLKNASDFQTAIIAGIRWEATKDLTLAATWHQQVDYRLEGEIFITFGLAEETSARSRLELPVPQMFRLGLEWKLSPRFLLRNEVEFSQWSILDRQRSVNLANGEFLLDVAREFSDTYKSRLTGKWQVNGEYSLLGLLAYETGATPTRTHEPGLAESNNLEFGLGASWKFSSDWTLKSSFIWQEFDDVTVTDSVQRPPQNGHYTDRRLFLTTDMEVRW